jgi:hypothetical protein
VRIPFENLLERISDDSKYPLFECKKVKDGRKYRKSLRKSIKKELKKFRKKSRVF